MLRHDPPPEVRGELEAATLANLGKFSTRELSAVVYAAGRTPTPPTGAAFDAMVEQFAVLAVR